MPIRLVFLRILVSSNFGTPDLPETEKLESALVIHYKSLIPLFCYEEYLCKYLRIYTLAPHHP